MKKLLGRIILRQNNFTIIAILLLSLTGCKSLTGGSPDWVANPKSVYPENLYLVAIGEANPPGLVPQAHASLGGDAGNGHVL